MLADVEHGAYPQLTARSGHPLADAAPLSKSEVPLGDTEAYQDPSFGKQGVG